MAAGKKDSNNVHLLIHDIRQFDSSISIKFENIAEFERNFDSYQFENMNYFSGVLFLTA
jgi:hypothetical protein